MNTPTCPVCERTFRDWIRLAKHLREQHAQPWSSDMHRLEIHKDGWVQCWCGLVFDGPNQPSWFAGHLAEVGNLHAHILEAALL